MSAITDFGSLQFALREELDEGDDYSTARAIQNGEALLFRRLRVGAMEAATTLTASSSIALPANFLEAISVTVTTSPARTILPMGEHAFRARFPLSLSGYADAYTIEDGSMIIEPTPAADVRLIYYARPAALSNDAPTNAVLTAHPDLYFAASLPFAYRRNGDMAAYLALRTDVEAQIDAANAEDQRRRIPQLVARPFGGGGEWSDRRG